jgi:hypothetical protein
MLNPNEQKKGGFGAFAAREQESHDLREAATPASPAAAATTAASPAAVPEPAIAATQPAPVGPFQKPARN